jgi:hypothetical protein
VSWIGDDIVWVAYVDQSGSVKRITRIAYPLDSIESRVTLPFVSSPDPSVGADREVLMLIGIGACVLALVMFCFGGSRPRKTVQVPATRSMASHVRTSRHQIHATRVAPSHGSPWSRRVVIRGGR